MAPLPIIELLERIDKKSEFTDGVWVIEQETMDIVEMVLDGLTR